ncbi:hypothetical protein QUA46_21435 [Microcoleus sp. MON2_D6]
MHNRLLTNQQSARIGSETGSLQKAKIDEQGRSPGEGASQL